MNSALDASPDAAASPPETGLTTPAERRCILTLLALALVLRVRYAFIYRIDSDEPQHLHVVWAWATGLLQYRDVFDNHAPLFHVLCAPFFRLFGERADIIIPMRLAMLGFYALSLWSLWKIGATLFSRRVGIWAAVFAALEPRFFYTSTEFRTDDMWAATWLLMLAVLVGGRLTPRRSFCAGLLLGATFGVSMKTSLLVTALGLSVAFTLGLQVWQAGWRVKNWGRVLAGAAAVVAGTAIIPAAIIGYFAYRHALADLHYCVIEHNIVPGLKRWGGVGFHAVVFAIALPLLLAGTVLVFLAGRDLDVRRRFWRATLFLTPLLFFALLWCFWPDLTREDYLPFSPLAVVAVAAPGALGIFAWLRAHARVGDAWGWLAPTAVAVIEALLILTATKPWHNDAQRDIAAFAKILRLTKPGDYVMDGKAGAIYRPRPFYYALETITRARMKKNLIPDNVIERMIATRTAVASLSGLLTESAAARFVRENYVSIGAGSDDKVRVLGKVLPGATPGRAVQFEVVIGANYAFVDDKGSAVHGMLDGTVLSGAREIAAGRHELVLDPGAPAHVAIFWENALEKGFLPAFNDTAPASEPRPRKKHPA